jgi:hypothetical protein
MLNCHENTERKGSLPRFVCSHAGGREKCFWVACEDSPLLLSPRSAMCFFSSCQPGVLVNVFGQMAEKSRPFLNLQSTSLQPQLHLPPPLFLSLTSCKEACDRIRPYLDNLG